jgi:hypothetical protein
MTSSQLMLVITSKAHTRASHIRVFVVQWQWVRDSNPTSIHSIVAPRGARVHSVTVAAHDCMAYWRGETRPPKKPLHQLTP